jgi:hypothetical protein
MPRSYNAEQIGTAAIGEGGPPGWLGQIGISLRIESAPVLRVAAHPLRKLFGWHRIER